MTDYSNIHIESSLPKPWEQETTFNDTLYDWMGRAPWLAISAAAHLLAYFILSAIPWSAFGHALFRFWVGDSIGVLVTLPLLLFLISMMIVGGVGTVWGPLVGAVLLMGADELLKEDAFADARAMGLGVLLAAFVVLMPKGVVGTIDGWLERRRNRAAGAR